MGPTAAPTPECSSDSDCDDGDSCTVDTCENGLCLSTPDCASCGKTKVDVEITIDNYGGETTYDIKDASDNIVMQGSGWPANSVNSFWKCFSSGSYTFTITDAYGDGICCSYGSGGYKVEVDDKEVASGGDFGSKEEKTSCGSRSSYRTSYCYFSYHTTTYYYSIRPHFSNLTNYASNAYPTYHVPH